MAREAEIQLAGQRAKFACLRAQWLKAMGMNNTAENRKWFSRACKAQLHPSYKPSPAAWIWAAEKMARLALEHVAKYGIIP